MRIAGSSPASYLLGFSNKSQQVSYQALTSRHLCEHSWVNASSSPQLPKRCPGGHALGWGCLWAHLTTHPSTGCPTQAPHHPSNRLKVDVLRGMRSEGLRQLPLHGHLSTNHQWNGWCLGFHHVLEVWGDLCAHSKLWQWILQGPLPTMSSTRQVAGDAIAN